MEARQRQRPCRRAVAAVTVERDGGAAKDSDRADALTFLVYAADAIRALIRRSSTRRGVLNPSVGLATTIESGWGLAKTLATVLESSVEDGMAFDSEAGTGMG